MPETLGGGELVFQEVMVESALPGEALEPDSDPLRIGPGDVLDIEIVETPNTLATVLVMPDGMLHYDLAGGIQVRGITLPELERKLAERLLEHYPFPIVSINLTKAMSKSYTILGQVNKPGTYPLGQATTLLEAIAGAGGFVSSELGGKAQDIADLGRSIVVRDNKIVPSDFEALVKDGDMSQNIYVRPGDYIFLPAEGDEKVFVLGAVNRPTGVPYSSRLTLISAVAAALGPRPNAFTSRAILLRGSLKEPQAAVVDLKGILRGKAPNFHLQPGDILWVPKEPWYKLEEYGKVAAEGAGTAIALQQSHEHWGTVEEVNVTKTVNVNDPVIKVEATPESIAPVPPVDPDPIDPDPIDPDPIDPDPVAP